MPEPDGSPQPPPRPPDDRYVPSSPLLPGTDQSHSGALGRAWPQRSPGQPPGTRGALPGAGPGDRCSPAAVRAVGSACLVSLSGNDAPTGLARGGHLLRDELARLL